MQWLLRLFECSALQRKYLALLKAYVRADGELEQLHRHLDFGAAPQAAALAEARSALLRAQIGIQLATRALMVACDSSTWPEWNKRKQKARHGFWWVQQHIEAGIAWTRRALRTSDVPARP